MKKISGRKKKAAIVCGMILALILLIPVPLRYKDGGTVEYRAVLYSVKLVHTMAPAESGLEYVEGTVVTILGIEVFDNVAW
ncbi:MAG: hypothetical protein NC254_06035 [bacterium]|nr:hypothetical protein [bacterium]